MLHQRFPNLFTNPLIAQFLSSLAPTPRAHLATLSPEQREKEETARVARQRPLLRVCSELALVGIISDGAGKSGGEWIMKILKELVCALCQSTKPRLSK
jgi:regulator of nonsense transcripts 2